MTGNSCTIELEWLPDEVSHWKELVKMSDGVSLATQVYLPKGEGPFPVLIGRGARKGGQLDLAHWYLARGFETPAPIAHNTLHLSKGYPSRIILPVLEPGTSIEYNPARHSLCRKIKEWDK